MSNNFNYNLNFNFKFILDCGIPYNKPLEQIMRIVGGSESIPVIFIF